MATLIVYATKNGATEKAAKLLSQKLGNCDLVNISKQSFDLSKYDTVIIGSNVRMGMFDKKIRKLLLAYIKPLTQMNVYLFACCCFTENIDTYFSQNVPPQLLEKVIAKSTFGGELDKSSLHGVDKIICNMVTKADAETGKVRKFGIDTDAIDSFANRVNVSTDSSN